MERVSRAVFALTSITLMVFSAGLTLNSIYNLGGTFFAPEGDIAAALLDGIGSVVVAIAVFDVAKYLIEEEVVRGREMRQASEARESLTKFLSTIVIAVFLEGLVIVFQTKGEVEKMLYPTLLLFAGVALILALGAYQHLSATVESEGEEPDEA